MKTMGLILVVVALHCAVIGSVCFISGCGTTSKPEPAVTTPIMPPSQAPQPEVQPAITPPPPVAAKEVKTAGGGEYIVQAGDSLGVIAKRCHITKAELMEANKLTDPNKLKVGQKLILPASGQMPAAAPKPEVKAKVKKETAPPAAVEKAKAVEKVQLGANEYVVQPGDNLSKIAAHFGVKVSVLREANKLQSDKIKVGQKIIIPEAKPAAPADAAAAPVAAVPPAEPKTPAGIPENAAPIVAPASAPAPAPVAAPGVKGTEVTPAAASTPVGKVSSSGITHVVQPGDDLVSIAKQYAVSVDEISELNQLSTNRTVQVGQRLKIP